MKDTIQIYKKSQNGGSDYVAENYAWEAGETLVKVILSDDGGMLSAYLVK